MFLLSQNDENQSENGSKNSKIRLRARPPAEPQKKMLQTKKLRSKSWKTQFFFTFRLPILDGRVHEQVSSVLFFTVFFEGERHDLSKTGGFGRKMAPPPGKPVTFYECHPEDHAPAPSVRADFKVFHVFRHVGRPKGGVPVENHCRCSACRSLRSLCLGCVPQKRIWISIIDHCLMRVPVERGWKKSAKIVSFFFFNMTRSRRQYVSRDWLKHHQSLHAVSAATGVHTCCRTLCWTKIERLAEVQRKRLMVCQSMSFDWCWTLHRATCPDYHTLAQTALSTWYWNVSFMQNNRDRRILRRIGSRPVSSP